MSSHPLDKHKSIDLFDLFQRAASVLVTVREGRCAGFSGWVSGAWPPHACYPAPLRRRWDVVAAFYPALTMFMVDNGIMGYFVFGREAHG